ncbi:hypothetical protein ABS71_17095 [bacterium SCN 62-11]|nr:hypothetical protein [Candidatus Eremiobacteraeota bacterium]ODT60840.1 MAG: hypothetical protein ABS71_17095 [bacterium SCN 62-11]
MAICGWCGRQTSRSKEFQNGSAVLRLCPDCAENGIGRTSAQLLHQTPPPDDDAIPPTPRWILTTAKILLLSMLLPALYVVYLWSRSF